MQGLINSKASLSSLEPALPGLLWIANLEVDNKAPRLHADVNRPMQHLCESSPLSPPPKAR